VQAPRQRGDPETVQKVGGAMGPSGRCSRELGMKWRVMLELVGADGIVGSHEVGGGRAAVAEYAPRMIGLTLEEGKHLLAACICLLRCRSISFELRRRIIAVTGDAASAAAHSDPSRISAPGGWCRCSARWRSVRRALPRVGAR
jgi:hypothetical protein